MKLLEVRSRSPQEHGHVDFIRSRLRVPATCSTEPARRSIAVTGLQLD